MPERPGVLGDSAAALGPQPSHEHSDPVRAAAGSLGGGEDGPLPQNPRSDNVKLQIDGVLHMRILDPFKASYGVEDLEYAVTQLAQTTMRSELGKLTLNEVFRESESLKANILHLINLTSDNWGIRCLRYEIKDIDIPPHVQESMQMAVVSEWKKRGTVVESEGTRKSAIIVAEGRKQAQILISEGEKAEQINIATGEAIALLVKAEAKAKAISILADALSQKSCWSISNFVQFVLHVHVRARVNQNRNAVTSLAKRYISAFSNLEKTPSNTIILPSNTGDVSSMVTQATAIYGTLSKTQSLASVEVKPVPADDDFKFKPLPEIPSPESTSSQ